MKGLFGLLITVLVVYVIYFDLTVGTLPSSSSKQVEAKEELPAGTTKSEMPYFDAEVQPGETVISIVEHKLKKQLPVSITDLVNDFKKLNPGESPEKIQIGTTYHFPDYSK